MRRTGNLFAGLCAAIAASGVAQAQKSEIDELIERQSATADRTERKRYLWEIETKMAADGARPIIFYDRRATCWQPYVKDFTLMINSTFNGARMEDVWLDK